MSKTNPLKTSLISPAFQRGCYDGVNPEALVRTDPNEIMNLLLKLSKITP